jgi:cell fate regulator YaaT (PSP1 superfamily)
LTTPPTNTEDVIAVTVKFQQKQETFFVSREEALAISMNDYVFVMSDSSHRDIGIVLSVGVVDPKKSDIKHSSGVSIRKVVSDEKIKAERCWEEAQSALPLVRSLVEKEGLDMKVVKVIFSFDEPQATIYYTAPKRVDFRILVKDIAKALKRNVSMKHISSHEEVRLLGGLGPYGPYSWWPIDRTKV